MGIKLCCTGLTIIMAANILPVPAAAVVGAVLMVIGCVLVFLDR